MKRFLNAQTFLLSYPNMNANVWGCFLSHKVLKKRARKCFLQLYIQLQYNRGFYFPICMICFLRSCPFIQINLSYYSSCLVLVWRLRPVLHYCIVIYFWSSGIRDCILFTLIWKKEFRICTRERELCDIFHYHLWTASTKPRLIVSQCWLCFLVTFSRPDISRFGNSIVNNKWQEPFRGGSRFLETGSKRRIKFIP